MPTTRPQAGGLLRHQVAVLRVAEGFMQSQVLFALVRLGMFPVLGDGAASAETLARALNARPDALLDWLRNLDYLRDALPRLDGAARTGRPTVDPGQHLETDPNAVRDFTLAMHNYAALRGRELARFLDTGGCRTLLDLGCGPGT